MSGGVEMRALPRTAEFLSADLVELISSSIVHHHKQRKGVELIQLRLFPRRVKSRTVYSYKHTEQSYILAAADLL